MRSVGEYIRSQRSQAQMSVRRLAEMSGVSNPYISQIERGLKKPSADVLMQISKALSIAPAALYHVAGLLDSELEPGATPPPAASVIDAIGADPHLTDEQKRSLVQVYESFRQSAPPARTKSRGARR